MDIFYFYNHEPTLLVYNQREGDFTNLQFLRNRERINMFSLRLLFVKRRTNYEIAVRIRQEQMKDKSINMSTMD
jgi:hypothetical protein